jgi:NAD(P)H-hydrate epimerase
LFVVALLLEDEEPVLELLTTEEMGRADEVTIDGGTPGVALMENAGRAVADAAIAMVPAGSRIVVVCGPGNNGGDGFVAARLLREQGYRVRLGLLGSRDGLKGDAAVMAGRWSGAVEDLGAGLTGEADLIIDALFGAGLTRALSGAAADVVQRANAWGVPVLAVDVPSGLDGTTGEAPGPVIAAARTVTFFRRKPAHLLYPGRRFCGPVIVADIGIPDAVLAKIGVRAFVNAPALWQAEFPRLEDEAHKYTRGHAVVMSGPADGTGAARLAARGALRIGSGLVTVVGSAAATAINATHLTAIMVKALGTDAELTEFLSDQRRNAILLGPGAGVGAATAATVMTTLGSAAVVVLDADALTSFALDETPIQSAGLGFVVRNVEPHPTAERLFEAIKAREASVVLTPHEGEFKRLFGAVEGSKLMRARSAAATSGAVVVLKGPDTVIAHPDGRAAINENAPPWLATAGSGDVLAGFVTGLLAQKMPAFEAACAAVWLHGECANAFGRGLIAEDLPEALPSVLQAGVRVSALNSTGSPKRRAPRADDRAR